MRAQLFMLLEAFEQRQQVLTQRSPQITTKIPYRAISCQCHRMTFSRKHFRKSYTRKFSLVETAKANTINPYDYLCWVLKRAPTLELDTHLERAARLLPECYPR